MRNSWLVSRLRSWCGCEPELMSADWLHRQKRSEHRVEYHGVAIRFPINRRRDESGWWNRVKYRTKGAA